MKYEDGQHVMLGDVVDLGQGERAVVVCIIDEHIAVDGYDPDDWAYLGKGVIFKSDRSGNTYFSVPDEDTELQARAGTAS